VTTMMERTYFDGTKYQSHNSGDTLQRSNVGGLGNIIYEIQHSLELPMIVSNYAANMLVPATGDVRGLPNKTNVQVLDFHLGSQSGR
jgi:hypothetical protein